MIDVGLLCGQARGHDAPTDTSGPRLIRHGLGMAVLPALCPTLAACGTPISVERVDARTVQTELTSNALTTGRLGRFVTLPPRVTWLAAETLTGYRDALRVDMSRVRLGSVYGMAPGSPFSKPVSSIPVAPSVTAHSTIAVDGNGPVETGDDGVVQYGSAHIDGAASELVIWSRHSVQSNPKAVAEVRRILLVQWRSACPQRCPTDAATAVAAEAKPSRPPIRRLAPVGP
jgi:hypothetical protein